MSGFEPMFQTWDFCPPRIWPPWEMKPPCGVLWLRCKWWDGMGWFLMLGDMDGDQRCHQNMYWTQLHWTFRRRSKLPDQRKNANTMYDEFGKGSIHRLGTIQVYGIMLPVSSSGHNLPLQPPASTKFGSSGHPVETWKPPLQDLRHAWLEDLSSHFPSPISMWGLSRPKFCEPSIILSVFAGKNLYPARYLKEKYSFILRWVKYSIIGLKKMLLTSLVRVIFPMAKHEIHSFILGGTIILSII